MIDVREKVEVRNNGALESDSLLRTNNGKGSFFKFMATILSRLVTLQSHVTSLVNPLAHILIDHYFITSPLSSSSQQLQLSHVSLMTFLLLVLRI